MGCYARRARKFLEHLAGPLDAALRQLDAGQVTSFMVGYCRVRNPESAKATVTAVRALLRFWHLAGHVPMPLAGAVPAVAGWRLVSLPRGLDAALISRLLASCERGTVTGRRDFTVLTVLARLGLRGAEVAALELGDVDWLGGEVAVRGKGSRIGRLPLPADVGEAVAAYLMAGRPRCGARTVFCTVRAPYQQLAPRGDPRDHGPGAPAGPGCPGPELTGCGTRWRPRCCGRARRCPRSGTCSGTAASSPRRFMPT